jgi:integrase
MMKQQDSSNVTKLRRSHNVYEHITSKIADKYNPKSWAFYIRDTQLVGFWIRVEPNGRKSYGCYGRLFGVGNQARVTIGNTDNISASKARKLATKYLQDIKAGIDPKQAAKAEANTLNTIESLMEQYLETKGDSLRTRYIYDFQYRLRQNFSVLLRKDVSQLTTEDLRTWWLTKQGKTDPKGSKRVVLSYLSPLLNFAIALDLIEKNVAHDFKKIIGSQKGLRKGSPKKRHIKKADMKSWIASFIKQSVPHAKYKLKNGTWATTVAVNTPALFKNNPTISETQRDFILFLLLTGKRLDESAKLTWKDLDWNEDLPTITLQSETTKTGRQDVIPMTHVVGSMLEYRCNQRTGKHKKWVFENKYGSGPIVDCRKSLQKIGDYKDEYFEINLPEIINHHDLRRTYATMAEETGISKSEIATLLSHATGDVTEGYITRSLLQNRKKRILIENEILQEDRWFVLVAWYDKEENLLENWDQGPQDERPKVGFLEQLNLSREEHDKYRWE